MSAESELESIATQIAALESRFVKSSMGMHLQSKDEAEFVQLVAEAISLLNSTLEDDNDFSRNIAHTVNSGNGGYFGGPSFNCVQKTHGLIIGAVNHLKRLQRLAPKTTSGNQSSYVDSGRITELKAITSPKFDLSRLVQLCNEINAAHANECMMSIAMLARAITDHVPPIFGQTTFAQVANNYSRSKSFKRSMQHLDTSLRNVADAHLHTQVRTKEVLPTLPQVDFRADLDMLLAEIVRILKP